MVQVSATNKGRYPQPALGKEWKLLGLWGQASGLEAPSISAPTARDIIPPILLCTTHVTSLNSQSPVNSSPCLRYTILERHHDRIANEPLRIKPLGVL